MASENLIEWKRKTGVRSCFRRLLARAAGQLLGLPDSGGALLKELGAERLFLDGLLSVWHPKTRMGETENNNKIIRIFLHMILAGTRS